jgi:hypothetical protein
VPPKKKKFAKANTGEAEGQKSYNKIGSYK